MLSFGMIQCRMWESPSVRGLSDQGKLAFGYLLANKHANMLGYYRLPLPYMADDLEWPLAKVEEAVAELERRGLIAFDEPGRLVFVVTYFKWHRLSAGACEKGAIDDLRQLPRSPLIARLFAAVREHAPNLRHLLHSIQEMSHSDTLFGMEVRPEGLSGESERSPSGVLDVTARQGAISTSSSRSSSRSSSSSGGEGAGRGEEPQSVDDPLTQAEAVEVEALDLMNALTGRTGAARWRVGSGLKARVAEGATREDILLVVEYQHAHWGSDPAMSGYYRPQTIFGQEKFPGYLGEAREWDRAGRKSFDPMDAARNGTTRWLQEGESSPDGA